MSTSTLTPKAQVRICGWATGTPGRNRTRDLVIWNHVLCQLSYRRVRTVFAGES